MAVMSDIWIRKMAMEQGMIEPFVETQKRDGVISYGLSSYGYDARVADAFKVFTNVDSAIVDPKQFNPNSFVDRTAPVCVIPPNSFVLAHTVEYFRWGAVAAPGEEALATRDSPAGTARSLRDEVTSAREMARSATAFECISGSERKRSSAGRFAHCLFACVSVLMF